MKNSAAIIIPTYNEKENLPKLTEKIYSVLKNKKINWKIIVVDDNSPDGTGIIADKLSKKYPLIAIHRTKGRGYGNSVRAGFEKAINLNLDIAITMDADFSHNPEVIPEMLDRIKDGCDVVVGSRRVGGGEILRWNWWRHFCSNSATRLCSFVLGLRTKDVTSGFRAYKTSIIKKIPFNMIKSNGYSFLEELLYIIESNGFKIKEIPITFLDRTSGKSKLSKKEIIKFFFTILHLKFRKRVKLR